MPKTSAAAQFQLLVGQSLKAELSDKERLISPVLFGVTMLLLFAFALGEVDASLRIRVYLAETFLTAFFALQLSFSRVFEPDRQDRVFDLMRTYPVSYAVWFLAKYTHILVLGLLTLVPTMLFGAFLHQTEKLQIFSWTVFGIALLSLMGLASLGILLSALTSKASARQILYPILYFPLSTPVLLAAIQASLIYLESGEASETVRSWTYLLIAFDVIYFTLGILLFGEIVDDS